MSISTENQNDMAVYDSSNISRSGSEVSPISSDIIMEWYGEKERIAENENNNDACSIASTGKAASVSSDDSFVEQTQTNNRIEQMMSVHAEALDVFARKNADYGDSFAEHGPIGVIIRMKDKISRLTKLTSNGGIALVRDESIRDTLLDLHNYSAMTLMLLDE